MFALDLLLGPQGRLGSRIARLLPGAVGLDRDGLDVTDFAAVQKAIAERKPKNVINCTGFADVDACESQKRACWDVNVRAVENLASACRKNGSRLVHFSSDFVLDPVNEYARSKLASEKAALPGALVIRTNFYAEDSFIPRKLLETCEQVPAFTDQTYNPISVYSLAQEVVRLLATKRTGIVNVATRRPITPFEFALLLCKEFGVPKERVQKASVAAMAVPRPKNSFIEPCNSLLIEDDLRRFHEQGLFAKR
jgi:dTDP-4-dehydrorhamnose reductase